MKRFLNILCVLCALAAIICLSATTVFAEETVIMVTDLEVFLTELVPGQPLPAPTVPENANYSVKSFQWIKTEGHRTSTVTVCEEYKRYTLEFNLEGNEGYQIAYEDVTCSLNGTVLDHIWPTASGQFSAKYDISLKTPIDKVQISVAKPKVGDSHDMLQFVCAEPEKYTCEIKYISCKNSEYDYNKVFVDRQYYTCMVEINPTEPYEFTFGKIIWINGEKIDSKVGCRCCTTFIYSFNYDEKVSKVEFPAWPEAVQPGPGGMKELTVPEGAEYRLAQGWMDLRTGETVETLVAGNVYTLAYVAIPEGGFRFTEETVFTLGGEACQPMGNEQYMVIYKPYDLGATKIDRVEITTPKFTKGYAPGNVTVAADAPYTVMETLWAESTTGKFDDAEMVEGPSFNTSIYAIPVLVAKDGYAFADDVKLFINSQEVAVEHCDSMVNVIELAGYVGTLTPPTTNGWHREDNTWAYYQGGEKVKNAWMKDSIGWVYLDENGLMIQNGFADDSQGTCYLGADGYMIKKRWVQHEGGWYYLDQNGYLVKNSWLRDSYDWCYVGADGKMYTSAWAKDSVGWCYVGPDGYMVRNAWAVDSQGICRLGPDGYMLKNQWVHDGEGWAYLDKRGYAVAEGWMKDSKDWCYISGYYMVTDVWVRDSQGICRIGSSGYMLRNQWVNDGNGWAYVDRNGYAVFNQFVRDSKGRCYIGSGGYMLKNQWFKVDGVQYYADSNGYVK